MKPEQFIELAHAKADRDYGLCVPPTTAQDGLNVLIKHFLGDDWYVTMPYGSGQVNTEAIYDILSQYRGKSTIGKRIQKAFSIILKGEMK